MSVLTSEQKLLAEYLTAIRMPLVSRLLVIAELWHPEATMEMLQYIAETQEQDAEKLSYVSCEIARKWKKYESLLDETKEQDSDLEEKWHKMWQLWMNDRLESPYQEILTYENEVRNGSHLQYFNWIQENENPEKIVDIVSLNLVGTVLKPIFNKAYRAYLELEKNEEIANQILQSCDDAFAEAANDIEKYMETITAKIQP